MKRWAYFAPVAALVIFAGYLGLRGGDVPSDSEIIDYYAATYLAQSPDGAQPTDCAAQPHPDDTIRMVITCTHPSSVVTTYLVGPRGQLIPMTQMEGPAT